MKLNQQVKDFIKVLQFMDRSKDDYRKFADFLELAYCAHAKVAALPDEWRKSNNSKFVSPDDYEKRYMAVVGNYEKDIIRKEMVELIGITIEANSVPCDFFGAVAGELGTLNSHMGQFFTPFSLSELMAKMIMDKDYTDSINQKGYISISEPACGSGGMIIASGKVLQSNGLDLARDVVFHAADLNNNAFKMAFLQLTFQGIAARVSWANTLTLEIHEEALTIPALSFIDKHKTFPPGFLDHVSQVAHEPAPIKQIEQLQLF